MPGKCARGTQELFLDDGRMSLGDGERCGLANGSDRSCVMPQAL
jgi:hypothetical protein